MTMVNNPQTLPSSFVEATAQEFEDLLVARTSAIALDDNYFSADWMPLWQELAQLGWTTLADTDDFSDLDLTYVAELWGRFLVPLPFMTTVAARKQARAEIDVAERLSFALSSQENTLVPFGDSVDWVLTKQGIAASDALEGRLSRDDFATSHPIVTYSARKASGTQRLLTILLTSEAVGAADECLRRTLDYVKQRVQFQRPVASFQAVKHNLANTHVRLELARSGIASLCGSETLDTRLIELVFDHCLRIAENCVQAHGGIGFTWEAPPHRYYRHIISLHRSAAAAGAAA